MSKIGFGGARALAAAAALTFSGCAASGMTAADCSGADWRAFGEADGVAGRKVKFFDERADDCRSHGFAVDEEAYASGRQTGLAAYCTEDGGYAAGKAGEEYDDVCPALTEAQFFKGYELGTQLFSTTEKAEETHEAYDRAVKDLDQHRFLLSAAEKRAASPTLDREEREAARQEADYRSGEIIRLQREIPLMMQDADAATKALTALRAQLIELGKEPAATP
ncbi:MAG: DUF2799 domain-containing protein [Parvularculaceae bacterium]